MLSRFLPFFMMCVVLASSARADSTSAWRIGGMIDAYARHTIDAAFFENLFNLELAMVDVKYTTSHVRARVALQAGDYVVRNYDVSAPLPSSFFQIIHAAHVGVRFGDELWVDVGIMPSHIGNETAISSDNICYTRSLIAETSPYYETGAKVSLQISDGLMAAILALNGWQNIYDWDSETAFGSLVTVEPGDAWKFGWSTYIGAAEVDQSQTPPTTRYFSDLYASFTGGDFTVAAALDIGKQELPIGSRDAQFETVQAVWYGATLQARWNLDSILRLNARLETYQDPENVMKRVPRNQFDPIIPYEVVGASIGLDVLPRKYTQLRFEGRVLHSPKDIFLKPVGNLIQQEYRSTELWFTAALVVTIP